MDENKKLTIKIPSEQKNFLELIKHEDAATSLSGAVQWCIDACMRIEKLYGVDACYLSFNDVRKERNDISDTATIPDTQGGLRWVKAIDKLPENNELKNIGARISGDIEALRFFNDKFHIYTKVGWLPIVSAIDTVFWLEESPQPKEPGKKTLPADKSDEFIKMVTGIPLENTLRISAYIDRELSIICTQLDESRNDASIFKEWYEKGQKQIATMTEELSNYREFIEWNETSMDNDEWTLNEMSDKMESILKKYPTKQ